MVPCLPSAPPDLHSKPWLRASKAVNHNQCPQEKFVMTVFATKTRRRESEIKRTEKAPEKVYKL